MPKQTNNKDDLGNKDTFAYSEIVGEFEWENRYYLILIGKNSHNHNGPKALSNVPLSHSRSVLEEVSRFELNGQTCMIVETEPTPARLEPDLAAILTARELQVATLVALGRVNKEIARQLHISEWTVSTYIRRIFAKLGVDSRAAMVYRCASLIQGLHDLTTQSVFS